MTDERAPLRNLPGIYPQQRRFGAGQEELEVTTIRRRRAVWQLAGDTIELGVAQPGGSEPVPRTAASIVSRDHVRPDRCGETPSGRAGHDRLRFVEAQPDARDEG